MVKAVKLADIAEKVGVSVVTVSKALSGQKGVSEEMRTRIKEHQGTVRDGLCRRWSVDEAPETAPFQIPTGCCGTAR